MRKIFHFASPRERYTADAAVVWCFDHRFDLVLRKLLKKIGVESFDPILVAGGAKNLASPRSEDERQFVLGQIRSSIRLHGTKNVILMLHSDCGAYGGLAAFDDDEKREADNHRHEMHKAVACLKTEIPEVQVRSFFVDFDGVWEADMTASAEKAS
jgi:carbonic anhydrase